MTDPQPLTGDELATIKARALDRRYPNEFEVPRLVAEIERLTAEGLQLAAKVVAKDAALDFKQETIDDLSAMVRALEAERDG